MSLKHLTLGERMVLAARFMTVEHIRQEADAAGVDLSHVPQTPLRAERVMAGEVAAIRQDLFNQPPIDASLLDADEEEDRRVA